MSLPKITVPVMTLPYFRVTGLQTFEKCSYKWAAEFLGDKKSPDNKFSTSGTLIHAALEQISLSNQNGEEKAIAKASDFLKKFMPPVEHENFLEYMKIFREILDTGYTVVATELEFVVSFDENFPPVKGHIDLVVQAPDGVYEIWDFKTNRRQESIGEWEQKLQPLIYTYGFRRMIQDMFKMDHVDLRYCIGYVNHLKNVKWLTTKEHDEMCVRRVKNIFKRIEAYSIDHNWEITVNSDCRYCPVSSSCDLYKSYTVNIKDNFGLLTEKQDLMDNLQQLSMAKSFIEFEVNKCEEKIKQTILSFTGKEELEEGVYKTNSGIFNIVQGRGRRKVLVQQFLTKAEEYLIPYDDIMPHLDMTVSAYDKIAKAHPTLDFKECIKKETGSLTIKK